MAVLQNCIAALPSYALHALEGPCLSTLARGEDSRKSACELCGVCSCVRSARRKPFRAGGFSFHWYIASPVFVRGGIFAESENVHPQVRAQVLRGLFVWANFAYSSKHYQSRNNCNLDASLHAKTQAHTYEEA